MLKEGFLLKVSITLQQIETFWLEVLAVSCDSLLVLRLAGLVVPRIRQEVDCLLILA